MLWSPKTCTDSHQISKKSNCTDCWSNEKSSLLSLEPHMGGWKAYLSSKLLHLQEQALEDWCQGQNILALVPFALMFSLGFFLSVLVCINLESAFTHCNTNMQVQYRAGWDHQTEDQSELNWTILLSLWDRWHSQFRESWSRLKYYFL